MIIESLIVSSILLIGVTLAFGIGFRGWGVVPIGYILGLSSLILFGAAQLLLRIPSTPRIALVGLLLCTAVFWCWYYWKNRPKVTKVMVLTLAPIIAFVSVVIIYAFVETKTFIYHVDSIEYLLIGTQLESNSLDRETNLFQLQKRMIGVPFLHSSANMFGALFLFTVTPLIALSTIGIIVWIWQQGLQKAVKDKKALWAILILGATILTTNERFVMHSFYVNGHLFFAVLLCLLAGTAWLGAAGKQIASRTFLLTQVIVIPTMVFTRPEAFLIVGLTLVPILSSRSFTFRHKAVLLTIFGVSVIFWHAFLAYLRIRHDVDIPSSVYDPILLGIVALGSIPILQTNVYKKLQHHIVGAAEIGLWLLLGLLVLIAPQETIISINASTQNIIQYWGIVAWVIPVGLFILALALFKFPHQSIIRFPITTFLPLVTLLIYIREGAYRFGNGDSLNRMWMQILPLVVMYIVLSFVLGKWRFFKHQIDKP